MLIGVIGYSSAFIGFLSGAVLTVFTEKSHKRVQAVLQGLSAGVLIAFVCFKMLPQAFSEHGPAIGMICAMAGTLASAWFDGHSKNAGLIFTAGIMLHGIPEGIALGGVLSYDFAAGMYMALLIAVHCLPESLILFGYLRGLGRGKLLLMTLALAAPVGLGAALGAALSSAFSSLFLAFAGGIMIYLACGGIFPEHGQSRVGILAAVLGFAAGVFILAL